MQQQNLIKYSIYKDKYSSASECMAHLHWLPIRQRIDHKVLTIVYCCLNNEAPEYLKDLLTPLPGGQGRTKVSSTI